ncbi:hypothetical protein [Candidatus Mycoplasma haematohominis]
MFAFLKSSFAIVNLGLASAFSFGLVHANERSNKASTTCSSVVR